MVAGAVLAPAGNGHVVPAAVPAASVGDHHVVPAIRQQLHLGRDRVRTVERPHRRFRAAGGCPRLRQLCGVHVGRDRFGYPFLQQQRRGLKRRVRFEVLLHRPIQQDIGQRQHGHALVMGHEGPHHGLGLPAWQAGRRVVDGFVETEGALAPFGHQSLQILARLLGRHHQRQRRRVGRHHQILGQSALQSQTGHAERPVLIIEMSVHGIVAGFRHAPGHPALGSILALPLHRGPTGLVKQCAFIGWHHQERHQVLEHRSAPREQDRSAADAGEPSSQSKPALLRQLSLRDGHEGGQPGLGRQQVVVARVASAIIHVVPDGQQVACLIEEEVVLHARQVAGVKRKPLHDRDPLAGALAAFG